MRYAMIMAGGAGTRLWPMSRQSRPKQMLPLFDGKSLLEMAVSRIEGLLPVQQCYICTSEAHRARIREILPSISDAQILGEPVGRDSVNAIAFTAAVLAQSDPDAVFAVLTADHIISPANRFRELIERGFQLAESESQPFVTFDITPTYAATQFGYIEHGKPVAGLEGCYHVNGYFEKPDAATAKKYLEAGNFGWSCGMFVFHAQRFLDALKAFLPESHEGIMKIANAWGSPRQSEVLNAVYPSLKRISVDYAIMEPASRHDDYGVCTVTMNIDWMDVGSWPSFGETLSPDAQGNRTNARAAHLDSKNMLCVSDDPKHVIATIGCEDLIVVRTADATLVCRREDAERVKELAGKVDASLK